MIPFVCSPQLPSNTEAKMKFVRFSTKVLILATLVSLLTTSSLFYEKNPQNLEKSKTFKTHYPRITGAKTIHQTKLIVSSK